MIGVDNLNRTNIINITGATHGDWGGQNSIVPAWKRGLDNAVVRSGSNDYDGGDRVIGQGAYGVDGDLLLTTGWGDGFSIRRLNNDGTLTKLYHDNYALYRDTTSTYNHINSMAFHAASSQVCLTTHNVNGYSMIDYSSLKSGGSTVVNTRPPSQYVFSNGANIDRSGSPYTSGTVTAGDWLYILDYDATHYKKIPRRHWTNGTQELLDGSTTSSSDVYTGSAAIDRNGYRGYLAYDEVNDRVYYNYYYNSNFVVVLDASTANPKILWCDLGDAGVGDDGYEHGIFIPEPTTSPNKVLIGGSSRLVYVDYSPCFTGSAPTVLKQFWVEDSTIGAGFSVLFRVGTIRQSQTNDWIDRHPSDSWFCPTTSDRGRNMSDGWVDWDNNKVVGLYRVNNNTTDTSTGSRGSNYGSDYSNPIFRMKSANGTYYWIKTGYGYHGHSFAVYSDSVKNELIGNWQVEYGTYTLSNSGDIDLIHWERVGHNVPSGCSISYFVSNNNGSSWESYSGGVHYFSSSGTQLRCKIVASGQSTKAPYKMATMPDAITYGTVYEGITRDLPMKIQRFKLKGRKF